MPLFEFHCRACGSVFEEILTLAELDSARLACPRCGSKATERGLSTFATGGGGDGGCGGGSSGFS